MNRLRKFLDRSLVRRILAGDKAAGERFVAEHYLRVYGLLQHLTGNVDVAADLTQQTFVKAWQSLSAFKGDSMLSTWLHSIAYHEYTHWLRDRHEHTSLDDAGAVADEHAADEMEAVLLRGALGQLSVEHREAFTLYHVEGLSISEVATVLDVPEGTVKSRLFFARRHLRESVSETNKAKEVTSNELQAAQPRRETC